MFQIATKFAPESANFERALDAGFRRAELWLDDSTLLSRHVTSKIARSFDLQFGIRFKSTRRRICRDQARSNRSRFITLFHAATKSLRNFPWESSQP